MELGLLAHNVTKIAALGEEKIDKSNPLRGERPFPRPRTTGPPKDRSPSSRCS
jgi:hypothetical protein